MTTLDPREDVQSRIDGKLVARMIVEFHRELRDTYGTSVMVSDLCAVGPLQSMIGLAIKNGHLAPSQPAAVGVTDEMAGLRMWARTMRGVAADGDGLTLTDGQVKALLRNIEAALRSTP